LNRVALRDAKYVFGPTADTGFANPLLIEKHGRDVVAIVAVDEYQWVNRKPVADLGTVRSEKS